MKILLIFKVFPDQVLGGVGYPRIPPVRVPVEQLRNLASLHFVCPSTLYKSKLLRHITYSKAHRYQYLTCKDYTDIQS